MSMPLIDVLQSESDVSSKLCQLVIEKANASIDSKQLFVIGVSGKIIIFAILYVKMCL